MDEDYIDPEELEKEKWDNYRDDIMIGLQNN